MVGVPGRSKGCVTCRKRKKGCDLKRPVCGPCEARGLVCGGYDNDRMFVNNTAASERALTITSTFPSNIDTCSIASSTPDTPSLIFSTGTSPSQRSPSIDFQTFSSYGQSPSSVDFTTGSTFSPTTSVFDFPTDSPSTDILLPVPLSRSAYGEKSIEAFFSLYSPQPAIDKNTPEKLRTNNFANLLSAIYARDEALRLALVALGTAVLGKVSANQVMMKEGRKLYGKGLQEMGRALSDGKRAESDALLFVPRLGALFEILFGADEDPSMQARSWRSHAQGEMALIEVRGPNAFTEGIAHQMFVDSRIIPIIAAFRTRKSTELSDARWKTIPWEKHPKTPKDLLFDILANTPGLLEDVDNATSKGISPSVVQRMNAIQKFKDIDAELKAWARRHKDLIYHPSISAPIPHTFPSLTIAYLTIFYWTASLLLYDGIQPLLDPRASLSRPPNPSIFARYIALSVPYFFHKSCGIWGAITVSFPMGVSLMHLKQNQCEENEAYLEVVYKAWADPTLPDAIRSFLRSMRADAARKLV